MFLKKIFFIFLSLFLFILDIACASLFEEQFFFFVLCFLCVSISQLNISQYALLIFLCALGSFLFHGRWGTQLLCIIPALYLAFRLQPYMNRPIVLGASVMTIFLIVNYGFLEPFILGTSPQTFYTIGKIFANVLLMIIL